MQEETVGAADLRENQLNLLFRPIAVPQQMGEVVHHQLGLVLWIENVEGFLQLAFVLVGGDPEFVSDGEEIHERESIVRLAA